MLEQFLRGWEKNMDTENNLHNLTFGWKFATIWNVTNSIMWFYRKDLLVVENYIVLYEIEEQYKQVVIHRVIYGRIDYLRIEDEWL